MQVKASICLLHIGEAEAARPGVQLLLTMDVNKTQDLYYETANALLETGYHEEVC